MFKNKLQSNYFLKPIFLIPALIIIGMVVITGSVLAYKKLSQPEPKDIVQKSLNETLKIRSASFVNKISLLPNNGPITDLGIESIELEINGKIDNIDQTNPKNYFNIKTNLGENGDIDLEILELGKIGKIDSQYFLKINSLPFIISMFLDTDTFNIKNQWINYNSLYNNQIKNIDSRDLEAIEKLQNNFWKKLEIVKLIEITETLNEEKINNQKNYHYRYVLNSKNIIKEIIKTYLETTEMPDWQKNWQELEKELEEVEFLDSYILGEIWINKNSLYLTKITGKIQGLKNEEYLEQGDIKALSFSLELFNIDKNQNIQAPEKSIDLETLLEKMGMNNNFLKNINNNLLKNTNNPSPTFWQNQENQEFFTEKLDMNSDLDSDNDGLSDFQEEYLYFSDPLNTDTDGDGYSDKEEVDNNFNPNGPGKLQ